MTQVRPDGVQDAPPTDDWARTRALLDRRDRPQWASLSWITLRPLISAVNDRINAFAPELVGDLRRHWMGGTVAAGRWPAVEVATVRGTERLRGVVDRTADTSFLLLGDPGEQDPSQYVLVPALREAAAGAGFLMLCSDVIYPSGDVNDYVHALYLPYGPDPDAAPGAPDPLATLDVLALPGNHDWYDGLSGFMFHFCGRPAPPGSAYGWREGIGVVEAMARLVWRRPSRPRPARLWRPDPDVGSDAAPDTGSDAARDARRPEEELVEPEVLRGRRVPGGAPWLPLQPGPYYAVETAHVLLVCIDTGMGHGDAPVLDAEQSAWLLEVSRHPKPKLLLTGKPLLVNASWHDWRLDPSLLPDPVAGDVPTDLRTLVEDPRFGYVATVGGDIHNYQQYEVPVAGGRTMHHLVSGGGGAYLSATHPVPVAAARLEQRRAAGLPAYPGDGVPGPEPVRMYPDAVASLQRFGRLVLLRVWRFLRVVGALLGGLAAGTALTWPGSLLGADGPGDTAVPWLRPAAVLATAAVLALVVARVFLRPEVTATAAYRAAVVGAGGLGGLAVALDVAALDPPRAHRTLAGWAGITAAGCLAAWFLRRSGWWREPRGADDRPPPWLPVLAGVTWTAMLLVLARTGNWTSAWFLVLLGGVALWGWRAREDPDGTLGVPWPNVAAGAAYVAQGALALALVGDVVLDGRTRWHPWSVAGGVLAAALLALVLLLATGFGLRGVARVRRGADGWRDAYGEWGHVGPWVIGTGLVLLPVVALVLVSRGDRAADAGWLGALVVTAAAVTVTVVSVLLLDLVRRRVPHRYKVVNLGIGAGALLLGWLLFRGTWVPAAALAALVVTVLAVLAAVLVNLVFVGTYALVLDRGAHHADDPDFLPFTPEQAAAVLAWRRSGAVADRPADAAVVRRARVVFPSTDQPQGPVQKLLSEIFDSDVPPFAKHFLAVTTTPEQVVVTPRPVDGGDRLPPLPPVVIPLPRV